jgi:hypothetical protein
VGTDTNISEEYTASIFSMKILLSEQNNRNTKNYRKLIFIFIKRSSGCITSRHYRLKHTFHIYAAGIQESWSLRESTYKQCLCMTSKEGESVRGSQTFETHFT